MSSMLVHVHRATDEDETEETPERLVGVIDRGILYRPDGQGGYRPDDAYLA